MFFTVPRTIAALARVSGMQCVGQPLKDNMDIAYRLSVDQQIARMRLLSATLS